MIRTAISTVMLLTALMTSAPAHAQAILDTTFDERLRELDTEWESSGNTRDLHRGLLEAFELTLRQDHAAAEFDGVLMRKLVGEIVDSICSQSWGLTVADLQPLLLRLYHNRPSSKIDDLEDMVRADIERCRAFELAGELDDMLVQARMIYTLPAKVDVYPPNRELEVNKTDDGFDIHIYNRDGALLFSSAPEAAGTPYTTIMSEIVLDVRDGSSSRTINYVGGDDYKYGRIHAKRVTSTPVRVEFRAAVDSELLAEVLITVSDRKPLKYEGDDLEVSCVVRGTDIDYPIKVPLQGYKPDKIGVTWRPRGAIELRGDLRVSPGKDQCVAVLRGLEVGRVQVEIIDIETGTSFPGVPIMVEPVRLEFEKNRQLGKKDGMAIEFQVTQENGAAIEDLDIQYSVMDLSSGRILGSATPKVPVTGAKSSSVELALEAWPSHRSGAALVMESLQFEGGSYRIPFDYDPGPPSRIPGWIGAGAVALGGLVTQSYYKDANSIKDEIEAGNLPTSDPKYNEFEDARSKKNVALWTTGIVGASTVAWYILKYRPESRKYQAYMSVDAHSRSGLAPSVGSDGVGLTYSLRY